MGRNHSTMYWGAAFFLALMCVVDVFAGARGPHRRVGGQRVAAKQVVAYAALDALERGEGWGRFIVHDAYLPSGAERKLRVAEIGRAHV